MSLIANISPDQYNALLRQVGGAPMQQQMAVGSPPMPMAPIPVTPEGMPVVGTTGNVPVMSGHLPPQPGQQLQQNPDGTVGIAGGGQGFYNQQGPNPGSNPPGVNPYTWPTDEYGNIIQGYPYYVRTIDTGHIYGR